MRWVEDRQENLTASFHGHEQRYQVRAAFGADGRILALAAGIDCDVGAYSAFPFTCAVEPLMAATELPGMQQEPAYRARGRAIATHKAPTAPYRGVSRPQLVLVMERLMEKAARELGLDPLAVRRRNMIAPGDFPYTSCNGITYDEGSYAESLDLAEKRVTDAGWPGKRDRLRAAGLLAGIGYSCFSERTAYGTPTMSQRRMRMTPGLRHRHGADGSVRRGDRDHRDLRPRPGPRDHVRADSRGPARRASSPDKAPPGRHGPGLLRLGHLGQPLGRDRRRRGPAGRGRGRRPAPAGGRAPPGGQPRRHRAQRRPGRGPR